MTASICRRTVIGLSMALSLALPAVAAAQGANYDRIVRSADLSVAPDPGGTGWMISARAWLANQSSGPMNLGGVLTIAVNGVTVGSTSQSMIIGAEGGGSCIASCAAQPGCVA